MRWDDASSPLDDWQLGEVAGAWNLSNDDNDDKDDNDDNDENNNSNQYLLSAWRTCARGQPVGGRHL